MTKDSRETLLILGTGFAAFTLIRNIDTARYKLVVVAPRNHFLFTPLLPSTTVGTIEFRSIIEPIRTARKGLRFHQAYCTSLDLENKIAHCEGTFKRTPFELSFDRVVVAVGAINNTFGVPGVEQHCCFLKEIADARKIRHNVIQCFERASKPNRPQADFEWLLHFLIVGGGPTGVEFAAELDDFIDEDLSRWFPDLIPHVKVTLIEAHETILSTFDKSLSQYTQDHFKRDNIEVRTNKRVKEVQSHKVILTDGEEVGFGLCVWSTGNGPTELVAGMDVPKDRAQRIITDKCWRVGGRDDVFAVGDCAVMEGAPLPQTAQVAQQAGDHLADVLHAIADAKNPPPFKYHHRGMLAYIGDNKALADLGRVQGKGFGAWLLWRSAYLTKLVSLQNKFLVASDWLRSFAFGRDISQY